MFTSEEASEYSTVSKSGDPGSWRSKDARQFFHAIVAKAFPPVLADSGAQQRIRRLVRRADAIDALRSKGH